MSVCICVGTNDVAYLERLTYTQVQCGLGLAVGHVFILRNHMYVPWCMQHLHTHLCLFCLPTADLRGRERLKCRSAVSGLQVIHVKLQLFSNPLNGCEQSLWCPVFFCLLIHRGLINKCFSLFSLCRGDRRSEGKLGWTFYSFRFILDWRHAFSKARRHHHHHHHRHFSDPPDPFIWGSGWRWKIWYLPKILPTISNAWLHAHMPPDALSAVLLAVCLGGVSACVISGDVHLVTQSSRHL